MKLWTIGFTKKPASSFFNLLRSSGARRIVDVRLHNRSQLAGFAKRDDLEWFLRKLCGMEYVHLPELAPTKDILDDYRTRSRARRSREAKRRAWETYEVRFRELMRERRIEKTIPKEIISDGCLLCSEHEPHHCHRRLVAEYLDDHWGDIEVTHLQ